MHAIPYIDNIMRITSSPCQMSKLREYCVEHHTLNYTELNHIASSTGLVSEIDFSVKEFLSGRKNSVNVMLYQDRDEKHSQYTASVRGTRQLHSTKEKMGKNSKA